MLKNNVIIKKIITVFAIIIMISNFIMPNYVHAGWLKDAAEPLVGSVLYLLSYVGDAVLSTMQYFMKGTFDMQQNGKYAIQYSPGMIFSDDVAGLKINFISAKEGDVDTTYFDVDANNDAEIKEIMKRINEKRKQNINNAPVESVGTITENNGTYTLNNGLGLTLQNIGIEETLKTGEGEFAIKTLTERVSTFDEFGSGWTGIWDSWVDNLLDKDREAYYIWVYNNYLYMIPEVSTEYLGNMGGTTERDYLKSGVNVERISLTSISGDAVTKDNIAAELQPTIRTWYKALRTIALVGLLSVLVYVGIRIILSSSSAQDKAKYKNMLKDWIVALCILFALHYIMAFMLELNTQLNNILKNDVLEETYINDGSGNSNKTDRLMSELRDKIGEFKESDSVPGFDTAGYVIMYLALVILTVVFTIQYLKRVVFMAFLTIIAPMIALTYPLDKIKDGKAQAFSYWLREYIFNCLIQPVHLLIYLVFVASAIDFASENMLYAIVVLAFMVPAEKFIKEMFGMKSSSPTSTLGAAAGGAMVMSMLQKMKGKPPKEEAEKAGAGASSKTAGVRTATPNSGAVSGGAQGQTPLGGASQGQAQLGGGAQGQAPAPVGGRTQRQSQLGSANQGQTNPGGTNPSTSSTKKSGNGKMKKLAINGWDHIKSNSGRYARKGLGIVGGAAGGLAGLGIGLAAGVASGDLGEALKYGATGAAVGYSGGNNLAQNTAKGISDVTKIGDKFNKLTMTTEEYQNQKFDKEVFKSDGYKMIEEDKVIQAQAEAMGGISVKDLTQGFLNNGITDTQKIREALQAGITGDNYKLYSNAGETNINKIKEAKARYPGKSDEHLANMFKLAKVAPKTLADFKAQMIGRKFNGKDIDSTDAERMFKELVDFF